MGGVFLDGGLRVALRCTKRSFDYEKVHASVTGDRYRLVYTGKGETHVSSVVLAREEVSESLDVEARLHQIFGWTVTRGKNIVICRRGQNERIITVRHSTPLDDKS